MRAQLLMCLALAACGQSSADSAVTAAGRRAVPRDMVATVNGALITGADVAYAQKGAHGGAAPSQAEAVGDLVREELAAQRASALGLDRDPEYLEELHKLEAPAKAFARQRRAELYYRDLAAKVKIDDVDARSFYDANQARLRTVVHVWQILVRDRAQIDKAKAELAAGTAFEDVARHQFAELPPGKPPWEVGELRWNQVPEPWQPALDKLEVGATSDVIAGPRGRFWIIKVIERHDDPATTFDAMKEMIVGRLRDQRAQALKDDADKDLRAHGSVVRGAAPAIAR